MDMSHFEFVNLRPARDAKLSPVDAVKQIVYYLVKNTDLFGQEPLVTVPAQSDLEAQVQASSRVLPKEYRDGYSTPLLNNFEQIMAMIDNNPVFSETLCAPAYQRSNTYNATIHAAVNRFQVIIETLYDAFLEAEERKDLDLPLLEKTAPIAMFQKDGQMGPFTVTVDTMEQLDNGSIAIVSLPGTYHAHPLLWSSLGHEVGGHDVLHADPGLLDELGKTVRSALLAKNVDYRIAEVWRYWIDETASDVYGTLQYGPAFTINLIFFFAALNLQMDPQGDWMRFTSYAGPDGRLDPHPTDVLRVSVGIGVLKALNKFSDANKQPYLKALEDTLAFIVGNHNAITLEGLGSFNIKMMQQAAELVGETILVAKLQSFKNNSIQQIITWSDDDEQIVQSLVPKVLDPNSDMSDSHPFKTAAHILTAGNVALLGSPSSYTTITDNVNKLLDLAYKADPTWSTMKIKQMYLPGPKGTNRMTVRPFKSLQKQTTDAKPAQAKAGWFF